MIEAIYDFLDFWCSVSFYRFINYFWFFFIFDFTRYIFMDILIVLNLDLIRRRWNRKKYIRARQLLFAENPLVSVIAPGKNEGKHIPALAESLKKKQTYKNIEVIVIDDGSNDNTPEICKAALKKGLIDKFFRNEVRGGKASAANLALRLAKGKYIVHLDADSHLHYDAIEKILIPFYMDENIGAVGGDIRVNNASQSLAATLQSIEYAKSISIGRRITSFMGVMRMISGAFGAFRKDILDRIGGWDVGPGLDGDITLKHRKLGYKMVFEPESICLTNAPVLFSKLSKQRYRWDRSLIRFRVRKHNDLLLPQSNFNFFNFIAVTDNILFNLLLNINWWIYYITLFAEQSHLLHYLLPMNFFLYIVSNILQYTVFIIAIRQENTKKEAFRKLLYMPLMPIYTGFYLRMIRSYAYFMEFFYKKSYEDAWNPWKVSNIAKSKGL